MRVAVQPHETLGLGITGVTEHGQTLPDEMRRQWDAANIARVREQVAALTRRFPVYR
jgi:hypothetical protein